MENKKPWQSKTLIIGLIMAVAPFVPVVNEWIQSNNEMFLSVMGFVFMGLRLITKDKIVIS